MRIPRIYLGVDLPDRGTVNLPESSSHYLVKVLRMDAGRSLLVFNGTGAEYSATLQTANKRCATIQIEHSETQDRESPLQTHLAIGISRGERMDWVIQKATELGVSAITPLFSERTEVKLKGERLEKKMDHWRQITISACEQCQRNRLPVLNPASELEPFLEQDTSDLKLVLHHRSTKAIADFQTPQSVSLLIGPEGGLNDDEIALAQHFHFQPLTLGPRVLRTETAPVTALTAVQLLWGDLGNR